MEYKEAMNKDLSYMRKLQMKCIHLQGYMIRTLMFR